MYVIQLKYPLRRKQYLVMLHDLSNPIFSRDVNDARVYSKRSKATVAKLILIQDCGISKNAVAIKTLHEVQTNEKRTWKHVLVRIVDNVRNFIGI